MTQPRLQRILLAIDDSEASNAAVLAAAGISRHGAVPVSILHVWKGSWEEFKKPTCPGLQPLLDARHVVRQHGGRVWGLHLRPGRVATEIVNTAQEINADLVIVGARGNSALSPRRFTSVVETLVRTLKCPLLVVRPGHWPPQQLLIGDDGSPEAARAGQLAAVLGSEHHATGHLIESFSDAEAELHRSRSRGTAALTTRISLRRLEEQAHNLAPLLGSTPSVEITPDAPAVALRAGTEKLQPTLLAVGRRGLRSAHYLLVESTSEALIREHNASVLVVPRRREETVPPRRTASYHSAA